MCFVLFLRVGFVTVLFFVCDCVVFVMCCVALPGLCVFVCVVFVRGHVKAVCLLCVLLCHVVCLCVFYCVCACVSMCLCMLFGDVVCDVVWYVLAYVCYVGVVCSNCVCVFCV